MLGACTEPLHIEVFQYSSVAKLPRWRWEPPGRRDCATPAQRTRLRSLLSFSVDIEDTRRGPLGCIHLVRATGPASMLYMVRTHTRPNGRYVPVRIPHRPGRPARASFSVALNGTLHVHLGWPHPCGVGERHEFIQLGPGGAVIKQTARHAGSGCTGATGAELYRDLELLLLRSVIGDRWHFSAAYRGQTYPDTRRFEVTIERKGGSREWNRQLLRIPGDW